MRYKEIISEGFRDETNYIKFRKPVAVQAVNMMNQGFEKHGMPERAFLFDKFTVQIEGRIAGQSVDITSFVIDELGGGQYVSSPDDELDDLTEDDGQLPSANIVLNQVTIILEEIVGRYSNMQTGDSSSASAPDTSKFTASHSGKLKLVTNATSYGYGGTQTNLLVAIQIGSAMGRDTVNEIQEEAKSEFLDLSSSYGQQGGKIKANNGDKTVTFIWRESDGSNYSTSGVSI